MDYLNWPKNQVNEQQQQLFLKVVNIGLRFIAFVVIFWANPETQRTKRQASFILERVPIPFFFLHHLHSRCWTESSKFTESYFCPPIPHSVCVLVKRDVNTYVCIDFFKPQHSCMLNSLKVLGGLTLNPVRWRQLSQHWTCSAHIIIICIFYGKGRHVGGYQRVWITPRLSDHPLHPSCQLSLFVSHSFSPRLASVCLNHHWGDESRTQPVANVIRRGRRHKVSMWLLCHPGTLVKCLRNLN